MVKFTLSAITGLAAMAAAQETSPSTISQLTQDLALSQMCPITGKVNFVNNCPFDLHIWRYDSSVDKAAVLSAKNTFSEPIRQDFRSGLLGYKVATDGRAVHDGYAWLNLNYRFVVTKNHANGLASVGTGFTNPLEGYSYGTSVSLGPNCKELHSSENGTLKMKSVECDEPTFKGQVDYEFCI